MTTAVELFAQRLIQRGIGYNINDFEEAKEMEKEQIEMAFFKGLTFGKTLPDGLTAEQYYNETFKQEQ